MGTTSARSSFKAELKKLTRGLTFQSESDFPVKPFFLEGSGRKSIKASDLPSAKKLVRQIDFEQFFSNATSEQEWYGSEEREIAARFRELVNAMKANLTDITVYKVGEVEINVYAVGRTTEGDFAGVTTKVVET